MVSSYLNIIFLSFQQGTDEDDSASVASVSITLLLETVKKMYCNN